MHTYTHMLMILYSYYVYKIKKFISKSVFISFFFAFFIPCFTIYKELWPKIATNRIRTVLSLHILHAIRHQSAMKLSSFSKTFFHLLSFYDIFIYLFICDHSFGHASRITQIAHFAKYQFRICLVYVPLKGTCTNYMANVK